MLAISAAVCAISTPALAQNADQVFGDRGYALALDEQCGLFTSAERAALEASFLQARGALLRADYAASDLDAYQSGLVETARDHGCDGEEAISVAQRVSDAFLAYQRVLELEFPGSNFTWFANRPDPLQDHEWLIRQDTGTVQAGLARFGDRQAFTVTVPDEGQFASVILVLRDVDREPALYDPTVGGLYPAPAAALWARWTPPDYAREFVWAAGRLDETEMLALTGATSGLGYRFPENALRELSQRDPRETARIDFLDRRGQRILSHYFEIGDFGAALAFLRAAPEPAPASGGASSGSAR